MLYNIQTLFSWPGSQNSVKNNYGVGDVVEFILTGVDSLNLCFISNLHTVILRSVVTRARVLFSEMLLPSRPI